MTAMTMESLFTKRTTKASWRGATASVKLLDSGGAGIPAVLLPPFRSGDEVWGPTGRELVREGQRTIVINAPAEYPDLFATAGSLVEFLVACLDALGIDVCDLVVWSWSGFVAQEWDAYHGERIRNRVMCAPGMNGPMAIRLFTMVLLTLVKRGMFPLLDALFLHRGDSLKDPRAIAAMKGPQDWKALIIQAMVAATSRLGLRIHHRTLVLYSYDDPLVVAGIMWFWWLVWGSMATFVAIPDGGHGFPYHQPKLTATLILKFLNDEYIEPSPPDFTLAVAHFWAQLMREAYAPWYVLWHKLARGWR